MKSEIKKHHQAAIDNLVKEYHSDDRFPALIIGGSIAKGCARDDSDVDFIIVATDEEYDKRKSQGDLFINRRDLCDYPNGFVDGKVINFAFLSEVANHGNEPSRAAFEGAMIAYSRLQGLEEVLSRIPVYPEQERESRMKSFYSMAFIQNWLMGEAMRHGNIYTQSRAASQLALYAGRLILAYNRILFPYHKWFLHTLEKCPEKPADFVNNIQALLQEPVSDKSDVLFQSLKNFKPWGVTDHEAYMWFMTEIEWSWMRETTPLEDL